MAVNLPMGLYEEAAQLARHDRRTISQWFRVAVEDAIKNQKEQLRAEGIELPEPAAPTPSDEVLTARDSEAIQVALKKNPEDRLLKIAASDLDNLGGVDKEKVKKIKLLMELLDS